jgi:capsule biosynthesis phosphatase
MMGNGKRFKDVGYISSKPLTRAFGKEILMWLLDSIDCKKNNVVIVCRADIEQERLSERLRSRYHDSVSIVTLEEDTLGAAHTVRIALESGLFDLEDPVIVCDSDTFYEKGHTEDLFNTGNCIFYFEDAGVTPLYSYLQLENECVTKIAEKEKISNFASVGTYCFESGKIALTHIQNVMNQRKMSKGEYYISTVFQSMIDAGIQVTAKKVRNHKCLGTPAQLQGFEPDKKLRICFDIDNTLVSEPKIPADYSSVEPISRNIEFLRYLKSQGHTIILQTARRMKTHSGNVGRLVADIGRVTFETLDRFEIPFDEIYFGKPYADFYIDDKGIDAYGDLERLTGVYKNEMIARSHNDIATSGASIVKSSTKESIKGELYWYLHAPEAVKDFLPRLLNHTTKGSTTSLEIERIDGPTLSKMLVSGTLQASHVNTLIDVLKSIHDSKIENLEIDICQNYTKKLEQRYFAFGDFRSEETDKIYNQIHEFLKWYEKSNIPVRSNIHGDPVFTNVIIDKNNRIRVIDMRGIQGDTLTLTGDRNYDFAKVYQSLVGYDFVIRKLQIDENRLKKLRQIIVKSSGLDENIISMLAASLLFSCIPLQPDTVKKDILQLAKACIEVNKSQNSYL